MMSSHVSSMRVMPRALFFYVATLITFFAASSVPTPLYRLYRSAFDLSPVLVTLVFAVYAFALLAALLIAGSLSDHLGRRPVIFAALVLEILAMAVFLVAQDGTMLIVARTVQGVATGIAASSLGAVLADLDTQRGPLVNSLSPLLGMTIGSPLAGALVAYAPAPLHLVYAVFLALIIVQAGMIWRMPETITPRPGAVASLRPRVAVPKQARQALLAITPTNIGCWMLGGFTLSLMPSVVVGATGVDSPLVGGAVVAALMASGALVVFLLRTASARRTLAVGSPLLLAGVCVLVLGVHVGSVAGLFAGLMLGGGGLGACFLGCVRSILPKAEAHERAELLAAYYIESYLSMSLPAIGAGLLAGSIGLVRTIDVFAAAVAILICFGVVLRQRQEVPRPARCPSEA